MDFERLPADMVAASRWVYHLDKAPYQPHRPGHKAASSRPKTWGTFDQALSVPRADGLEFAYGDGWVLVDLDGCPDKAGSIGDPRVLDVLTTLDSYSERSYGGYGLHITCHGTLPPGWRKSDWLEMYDWRRFGTVTGNLWPGAARTVNKRTAELAIIHNRYAPPPNRSWERQPAIPPATPSTAQDRWTINRLHEKALRAAATGSTFARLWAGIVDLTHPDGTLDHSRGDLQLCQLMAFWTGKDPSMIDAWFRQSGLMRDKWDRTLRNGLTYGQQTIARAIALTSKTYDGQR